MRKNSILMFAFLIVFTCGLSEASAQITITIPKFPKIKKPKIEQPTTTTTTTITTTGNETYDKDEFNAIKWGNTEYLNPYLECYAKKHNLELIKVTDHAFSPRGFGNAVEMKRILQAELPKLAEIESLLKSKLKARPNTSKSYHENPAIWEEITGSRDEYLQCAVAQKQSSSASESVWLRAHLENIEKMQKEVDEYTLGRGYLVTATNNNYLLFAVSPREREKWLKDSKAEQYKSNVDSVLDGLAASAVKKLPLYKPDAIYFKFRDAAAEKLLMGYFKNPATIKIHRIGVGNAGWQIQKDNYGLLPAYRYKYANVYYRDSSDDHPYCRVVSVRVKQDYAGGGTYSSEMYRSSAEDSLIGCPAGVK